MKKHVYEIDENGHIKGIHVAGFDEDGSCTEELAENIVTIDPPNGLYSARWTGTDWIEDMPQAEIDALNTPAIEQQIESLKMRLSENDYKIIKCSEYQLTGQSLPYNIIALHAERQALRNQINVLEALLV